jgi:hypothetical protein
VRVSVTQEHIDNGTPSESDHCPIALAILDILSPQEVHVNQTDCLIVYQDYDVVFELPQEAQVFVEAFDSELPVQPIEFDMRLPIEFDMRLHINEG